MTDIFVRDRLTQQTVRVNVRADGAQTNGGSDYPAISGDGRYVSFTYFGSDLGPSDTNDIADLYA